MTLVRRCRSDPPGSSRQGADACGIVAVGRGIKGQEHIPLAQKLADALGAELAASRPICDAGWLPMERQVGSSGQTVAPKVYIAVGISGAIQHLVGMKGARTVIAINKDPDAPIFELLEKVITTGDVIARLGGDEFAIITFGTSIDSDEPHHDGAIALARRVLDVINEPFVIETKTVFVGASIGVALAPDDGVETEVLLKKADLALYKSKAKGRNVYSLFDPQMMAETSELHKLEADMRLGLSRSEFEVHYQPIIDARTRNIAGAEALVRWRHPEHGLIAPAKFIPLAESTGLIIPLGEFVLHRACCDAMSWPDGLKVAVNLSAIQFRKTNLFDVIMCALIESGLPPGRLEVEVTESVLPENEADYAVLLHQLKNIGVSVALDDFGTGYSSLSYLKQFPFDKIKIDRSFTADVAEHEGSMAIVSAIIGLSRGLDMITTAEGIETERQFEIMRAAGVTLAQGYLFGRACPIAEFNATLESADLQKVAS